MIPFIRRSRWVYSIYQTGFLLVGESRISKLVMYTSKERTKTNTIILLPAVARKDFSLQTAQYLTFD